MELSVNTSPYGVGAVIMHVYPIGLRHPIAFASQTLNEHEKQYGQIDKEAGNYVRVEAVPHVFGRSSFYHFDRPQASGTDFWQRCVYSAGQLFCHPSTTASDLSLQSKTRPLMHCRGYLCHQH